MKFNLGKIIQDFDFYMGLMLLKSPKFFSYTVFDKILEKRFSKNQSLFIRNFLNQGFSKIDCNLSENVNEINLGMLNIESVIILIDKTNTYVLKIRNLCLLEP